MQEVSMNGASAQGKELNQILHRYQLFAMNTLGGPGHQWNTPDIAKLAAAGARYNMMDYKRAMESLQTKESLLPFDFKVPLSQKLPVPLLMRADYGAVQGEALLEHQSIACFTIGGEQRLCLPQILNDVLQHFSLSVINQACDNLQIYCSRCTTEQLNTFKKTQVLPVTAPSCGLITMTDAERLCGSLLHCKDRSVQPLTQIFINEACIPVYHECFGIGNGYLRSNLYNRPESECIECADCGKMFSTKQFVGHSHSRQENRVCHWGFKRENWRSYLLFDDNHLDDEEERSRLDDAFCTIVGRFLTNGVSSPMKRKESDGSLDLSGATPAKLCRHSESHDITSPLAMKKQHGRNGSDSSPIKIEAGEHAPALVNPGRVVSSSDPARYGAPNLELVQQLKKEDQNTEDMPILSSPVADGEEFETALTLQRMNQLHNLFDTVLQTSSASEELKQQWAEKFTSYHAPVRAWVERTTPGH